MWKRKAIQLQRVIGCDPGKRGIQSLIKEDALYNASQSIEKSSNILLVTGCNVPTPETDGPLGALQMANAWTTLGKQVTCAVDTQNAPLIQQGLVDLSIQDKVKLVVYPTVNELEQNKESQYSLLSREEEKAFDCVVSIEILGPTKDGKLYNMRGEDVTPLHSQLLTNTIMRCIDQPQTYFCGIGDGGNEFGMGNALDTILKEGKIKAYTACVVPCQDLIVTGVSNWGGYALSWLANPKATLRKTDRDLLAMLITKGAIDGMSKKAEMKVDGLDYDNVHDALIQFGERILVEEVSDEEVQKWCQAFQS